MQLLLCLWSGQGYGWTRLPVVWNLPVFVNVIKKGIKSKVVFLRYGIIFMIVTTCSLGGKTKKSYPKRIDPIGNIFSAIFFRNDTTFHTLLMHTVEGRC